MKKFSILLFAVAALTACTSGESKCEGEGCDSTVVAVDTTAVAPVAVDTNTTVAVDTTTVK